MASQRDAAVFDGTCVEEMNQQALAFADAKWITGSKCLVVDRIGHGTDFQAAGVCVQRGRLLEQRSIMGIVVIVIHGAGEERLPIAQRKEKFLIVLAEVVAALDVDKTKLACISPLMEVSHRHGMRVVP